MKTLLIGTLLLLIVSCKSEKEEFTQKIAGDDFKYWNCLGRIKDGENQPITKPRNGLYFKFGKNGDYKEYCLFGKNKMYDTHLDSDLVVSNKWKYMNNKEIRLNDDPVEILFLSEDSLAYRSSKFIYCFIPTEKRPKIVAASEVYHLETLIIP